LPAPGEQPPVGRGLTGGLAGFSRLAVSGVFSGIHEAIGQRTRIGRDLENEIVVDDPLVSRFHAELRARSDGRHELVDLGSRSGTFVNGRLVDRAILEQLDIVSVGHHAFRLVGSGLAEYIDSGSITFRAAALEVHRPNGRSLLRTPPLVSGFERTDRGRATFGLSARAVRPRPRPRRACVR
jgi:ABC transport system ATP-binding/permease protein